MTELKDKILNRIAKEKITPAPKWLFLLKDWVYGGVFALASVVGSLALAPFWHVAQGVEFWDLRNWKLMFQSLPYIWLALLGFLIVTAWYNAKHTRRGYRYHPVLIVAVSIIISMALSYFLLGTGLGEKIDERAAKTLPNYPSCMQRSMQVWQNPQDGTLSGDIKSVISAEFILVDFNGKQWLIDDREATWAKPELRRAGEKIKMTGQIVGEEKFKAQVIKPWKCSCMEAGRSEQDCRNGNCAGSCGRQ